MCTIIGQRTGFSFSPESTVYELALWQNHTFFLQPKQQSEMTAEWHIVPHTAK
jgi:hypothetical protein